MSFFNVDDQMYGHNKTLELCQTAAGRQALGLWTVAGSWCGGHPETQGRISLKRIRALGFTRKHAMTLEAVGFWDAFGEEWQFHNWQERRPKDAKLAEKREKGRIRTANHRARNAGCNGVTEQTSNALPGPNLTVPNLTVPNPPVPEGDWRPEWAEIFRTATGREDFSDGCGQYTGTEAEALRVFRQVCKTPEKFRERLTALLAADGGRFLPKQGLRYWADTGIRTDHTIASRKSHQAAPRGADYGGASTPDMEKILCKS